jgi:hypothetical protein
MLRDRSGISTELPDPEGTGIEDSGLVPQIYNMLCSGWSVWQVVIVLAQTEGLTLDVKAVQAYSERIPQERYLPATSLIKHFLGVKVITDPLGEMEMMLRLSQERLSALLEEEQGGQDSDEREKGVSKRSRANVEINSYWRKLREFAELQDKLGITGFIKATRGGPARGGPTLAEIIGLKVTERTVEIQAKAQTRGGEVIEGEAKEVEEDGEPMGPLDAKQVVADATQ